MALQKRTLGWESTLCPLFPTLASPVAPNERGTRFSRKHFGFFRCEARAAPTPTCTAGAGGPTWRPRWESRVRTGRSLVPKPRPVTLPDPPLPSFSLSHWSTARISATPPAEDIKAAVWSWEHHWELGACFFGTNWLLPGCYLPVLLVFCACLLPPHPPRSALRPQPCVGPSPASPPPAWKGQYELGGCPETRCFYLFILGGVTGFYLFIYF